MYLRYLHYLQLVIENGSFDVAARMAGVSQPAISHGLKQLQKQFDTPLFVRDGRKLLPTDVALGVVRKSVDFAAQLDGLTGITSLDRRRGPIRVGMTPSAALLCSSALYAFWSERNPHQRMDMSSADEGSLLSSLQRGELDLVVSPLPRAYAGAGLTNEPLYQLVPLVYAREAHPLVHVQSLEQLQSGAWAIVGPSVSGPVDVLHEAHKVRNLKSPRVAVSCPDYASLVQLMVHNDLLGVLPHPVLLNSSAHGKILALHLRESLPRYEMHLFIRHRSRKALEPIVDALRRLAVSLNHRA